MKPNEKAAFKRLNKLEFCLTCKLVPQLFVVCFVFLAQGVISAQTARPPQPLKLDAVVELALNNYPAIKTAQAQADAAKANIGLARTAYLPRLDLLYQENRATRNNVFGAVLPQSIVPGISGPVPVTGYLAPDWALGNVCH